MSSCVVASDPSETVTTPPTTTPPTTTPPTERHVVVVGEAIGIGTQEQGKVVRVIPPHLEFETQRPAKARCGKKTLAIAAAIAIMGIIGCAVGIVVVNRKVGADVTSPPPPPPTISLAKSVTRILGYRAAGPCQNSTFVAIEDSKYSEDGMPFFAYFCSPQQPGCCGRSRFTHPYAPLPSFQPIKYYHPHPQLQIDDRGLEQRLNRSSIQIELDAGELVWYDKTASISQQHKCRIWKYHGIYASPGTGQGGSSPKDGPYAAMFWFHIKEDGVQASSDSCIATPSPPPPPPPPPPSPPLKDK